MSDVVDLIEADHRELERVLEIMQVAPTQRSIMLPYLAELSTAHRQAEVRVLYPVVADDPDVPGEIREPAAENERDQVAELLQRLRGAPPESADFEVALAALLSVVVDHVAGQERDLLPFVRGHVGARRRNELAGAYARVRAEHFRSAGRPGATGVPLQRQPTIAERQQPDLSV